MIFDSPDPSVIREIINENIPYIYIFRKNDYELSPFGESYFKFQKESGRFVDLSEDGFNENEYTLAHIIREAMGNEV